MTRDVLRLFLVLALGLPLTGCPRDPPAPEGTPTPAPTPIPGDDDDDDDDDTVAPIPEGCDSGHASEVQLLDAWGRPLDGDLQPGVAPTLDSELGDLAAECFPTAWLACGETAHGDNSDPNSGATWMIDGYPVGVGNYSGGEVAYAFRAPASGTVSWDLVNPEPSTLNHDLFVLAGDDRCEPSAALYRGFNGVEFEVERGATYFLVVDAFEGEEGPYRVHLDCGGLGDPHAAEGPVDPAELPVREEPSEVEDGPFALNLSADLYHPTTVTANIVDGRFEDVEVTGDARWAQSSDERTVDGDTCTVHTLYVGLDHRWFSGSTARPPREGNQVDLLLSGEQVWSAVYDDLLSAQHSVHWSTWWWESDFELIRPEGNWLMTEQQRRRNTIMSLLDELPGVQKKVMTSRFCAGDCFGLADGFTLDDELEERGETPGDNFEVIQQGNATEVPYGGEFEPAPIEWALADRAAEQPEFAGRDFEGLSGDGQARFDVPIASFHQKMHTIDGEVAYVLGMNTKSTDWDTTEHRIFDPRRMAFDSDLDDRLDVLNKDEESDLGPRKDYGVRIKGPCVADVDEVLRTRWDQGIADDEPYSEGNSSWTPPAPADPLPGGVLAQFQVTLPAPIQERSILESLRKAFTEAEDYVLVEDQYWRVPILNEALLASLVAKPDLKLVVITSEVSPADPAAEWTIRSDETFREAVPDQYATYTTASFDWRDGSDDWFGPDVEVHQVNHSLHSKLVIVDDRFLSVGSANKNNRGMLFEGEANLSVLDETWVRDARRAVIKNLVGPRFAPLVNDNFDDTFELLADAAQWNVDTSEFWHSKADDWSIAEAEQHEIDSFPSGFLYPWGPPGWSILTPGPDAFK